jgi:hypothetical protein
MLRLIVLFLLVGVVGCDSVTAPGGSLVGQYELRSVNGDTTIAGENPDTSPRIFYGFVILRKDGSYSYALIMGVCNTSSCPSPEVRTFGGTWTARSSQIELTENADGTTRRWGYSSDELSGIESKFFSGSASLLFRKCGAVGSGGCALTPGT